MSSGASTNRVKVLYVAGWGRSGSTLLGRVLGQIDRFFLVGELRYMWDRGLIENRFCSCGTPFDRCPVWQQVVARTFVEARVDAEALVRLREQGLRTRHILLTPTQKRLQAKVASMGEYLAFVEKLYNAVREVSHSRVIVDTSKFPSYGYVLRNISSVDLYILHLVRDPRAAAYSWESRRKLKLDYGTGSNKFMTAHNFAESSLAWNEWNLAIENLRRQEPGHYMLLRYEDFVESPRSTVESILRLLGEERAVSPFIGERQVRLEVPHTFSGNPDRFSGGTVTIEPDGSWKRNMSATRQAAVAALTWPGLLRYKYPLRPQRQDV
jgi:Sulfotransferase family